MEQVLTLLQWLIPSGGVGMLLGWLTSSRLRRARTRREEHDTYMHLYEDTKQTLEELSHENSKMRHRLGRLETMLTRAYNCRYWGSCPIRRELQKHEAEALYGAAPARDLKDYLRRHEPHHAPPEDTGEHPSGEGIPLSESDRPP